LVIFKALLGMWTVTWLLKPVIVVAHLLGGMTLLLLLWWLVLKLSAPGSVTARPHRLMPWAVLALCVLYAQITLGGWTSANYAALVCSDFPTCQGQWWPPMDFREGFTLWRGIGQDYEGGILDPPARTAIHVAHRLGAVLTLLVILGVAMAALREPQAALRRPALAMIVLVLTQATLGVMNIVHVLPLAVAVAHNGVAALLLISVGTLLYHACSDYSAD
ncbi:MAG: COX15/CtaA family protein, partial [Thiotrichales bacterium]|nr:COX15/CtaA family protein [Thiotrichales bacterium]